MLEAGYDPDFFWNCSVQEVVDCIEAHSRKLEQQSAIRESQVRDMMVLLYHQAEQIANLISAGMSKDVRILTLPDYYPEFFDRPEIQAQKQKAEMTKYLADMTAYADAFNRKYDMREGGEEDGSRYNAGETEGAD